VTVPTATRSHERYVHEAVFHETAEELVEATAPLLRQALARGEDVALVCSEAHNQALSEALDQDDRLLVLPRPEIYRKAVSAVAYFRDFVEERLTGGAARVCILGEVDFGTNGRSSDEWRRYEALLNHALSPFPLWSLCAYDTRAVGNTALTTAEMTHPYVRRDGLQAPNPDQVDAAHLLRLTDAGGTPAPGGDPALTIPEVVDLGELHRQVATFLTTLGMRPELVEDLVVAVHEVAINGLRHGRAPVSVRLWAAPGGVQCAITDAGSGFEDPLVGYVRGGGDELPEGRFGLWLARQLCDEVLMARTPEGFTIRLVVDR
jgi:anti-sigma regulatory factor (Ser/Thr protein kinase)